MSTTLPRSHVEIDVGQHGRAGSRIGKLNVAKGDSSPDVARVHLDGSGAPGHLNRLGQQVERPVQAGQVVLQGRGALGQRGNRVLMWAFSEAAHGAVRKGGKWRAMFDRYTEGGKKNRNRGYIKVARELVKVVTAVWKNGTLYQETPPARPGAKSRKADVAIAAPAASSPHKQMEKFLGNTRSGTGQLSRPMVPAGKA